MANVIKRVRSVVAVPNKSTPCGTPWATLVAPPAPASPVLPASLLVTFDDASTQTLPITWEFGAYDAWDNVGAIINVYGKIAVPAPVPINNTDATIYLNPDNIKAVCQLTTTVTTAPGKNPETKNVFCNTPGQQPASGNLIQ